MAPLRFVSIAAGICLLAAPAFAQSSPDITLKLSPAEVAEIERLIDLAAPDTLVSSPPNTYWDLQTKILQALKADPAAMRAVLAARSTGR
jgi:hypothetical protein